MQYPPYGAPPPARKELSTGKVILIVLVAIVLVIAGPAVLYVLIAGPSNVNEELPITINMAMPNVGARSIGGTTHWDAFSNVNKVVPGGTRLPWSDVRVIVKSAAGGVLITSTQPAPDAPGGYDDATDGTVDVEVWFADANGDGLVGAADSIKLTGMTASYEGAWVEMMTRGVRIAVVTLPTAFP